MNSAISKHRRSKSARGRANGRATAIRAAAVAEALEPRRLLATFTVTSTSDVIDLADGVNTLRGSERSFLVITHYQRLLNFIVPDYVHVLVDGRIVRSGGKELALELEQKGYSWLEDLSPETSGKPAAQPVGA